MGPYLRPSPSIVSLINQCGHFLQARQVLKKGGFIVKGNTLSSATKSTAPGQLLEVTQKYSQYSTTIDAPWPYHIYASDSIQDRKSTFVAHASILPEAKTFPDFLRHLTALPDLKRATHCMYAYRTVDQINSQPVMGQNDGGEGGSGDRLSRLLVMSESQDVVLVVSRWFGGVKLGSDRWKRISYVAKQALERGNFTRKSGILKPAVRTENKS